MGGRTRFGSAEPLGDRGQRTIPYLSLYRKYRPRSFADIVGQRHVTQTLTNAIKANRIAHAYLFCGPRGTGKTTTALVLAMALNCEQGPTPEPDQVCESCRRIIAGNALDVIEIDAASNRGIDEIRELRERVGLAPATGRYKVYIIDEVHMLTGEAFNAFLKTLEEPPAHVVFVLATTEPHRVLPTILSRCQRFDFHRLGLSDLEGVVRDIAAREDVTVDEKAVVMLAHAADGSMRDALTLLDQAIAYAEDEVTAEVVTEILGGIDFDLLADFTEVLIGGGIGEALGFVDRIVSEGKDLRQMIEGLIGHFRNLLLVRVDRRGKEALSLPEESAERTLEQAQSLTPDEIMRALDVLAETDRELRFTSQPRLLVELAAARICRREEPGAAGRTPAAARTAPSRASRPAPERAQSPAERAEPPAEPAPAKRSSAAGGRSAAGRSKAAPQAPSAKEREAAAEAPAPAPTAESVEPSEAPDITEVRQRWDEVIGDLMRSKRPAEAAFLRESTPVELEGDTLVLEFSERFHHDQMTEKRRAAVAEAVGRVFGLAVKVQVRMGPGRERESSAEATPESTSRTKIEDVLSFFPGSELEE